LATPPTRKGVAICKTPVPLISLCLAAAWIAVIGALSIAACVPHEPSEGLAVAGLPEEVRADYDMFAQRCSKCHSLSRPLQSGISDDAFWKECVERMRRQPGSGISPRDEVPILRFLHYYSRR
jgi:hypothetical protein